MYYCLAAPQGHSVWLACRSSTHPRSGAERRRRQVRRASERFGRPGCPLTCAVKTAVWA